MTNKYINDEEPWKLKEINKEKMNNILDISLQQIAKISVLLNPIIPKSSKKVLEALNIKDINLSFLDGKQVIPNSIKINNLEMLFKKIS